MVAPSALRMLISLVRRSAANAVRAKRPRQAMTMAAAAQMPISVPWMMMSRYSTAAVIGLERQLDRADIVGRLPQALDLAHRARKVPIRLGPDRHHADGVVEDEVDRGRCLQCSPTPAGRAPRRRSPEGLGRGRRRAGPR